MRPTPSRPPAMTPIRVVEQHRDYALVTPLFGGGVEPQQADPITVVRASSVRGHLRFWWRATRGAQYADAQALRAAEAQLWGDTQTPSAVAIEVVVLERGWEETAFTIKAKKPEPSEHIAPYAAFPLLPKTEEQRPGWASKPVRMGVKFRVNYRLSKQAAERWQDEIEAAFWAWETFGGIGGRTRRGFGAIGRVGQGAPNLRSRDEVERHIREGLRQYVVNGRLDGFPRLAPGHADWRLTEAHQNAITAWKALIGKLQTFRQYRINRRTRQPDNYGASVWPEPQVIRQAARQSAAAPAPFPRARLGLPIVFHFPQDQTPDAMLVGRETERLASPLLLRPVVFRGDAFGLALVLSAPTRLPGGLNLKGEGYRGAVSDRDLTPDEARKVIPLQGKTDVLAAFLDWVTPGKVAQDVGRRL
ncbi:type III-B CRISPR module RAMP protein Cmr1 [Chloracidobacterium validum]|uniref:Type III-B CRISPR module RAMP protein Cmr1 n=1 Tax=Chloracidobacterium validum TaxID=2821543 RepID=A0ABX8BEI8_9BACT|nr:type III-B CRISPR module RAMP protein Cmr1 [Chloracidobacterium validum]QUW04048.1 type III-B CRISPR module RAMP protein Cmr1 [Chloracidobacterium validum]